MKQPLCCRISVLCWCTLIDDLQFLRTPEISRTFFQILFCDNSQFFLWSWPEIYLPILKIQAIFSVKSSSMHPACSITSEINKASEMLWIVWPLHFLHSGLQRRVEWFKPSKKHKAVAELRKKKKTKKLGHLLIAFVSCLTWVIEKYFSFLFLPRKEETAVGNGNWPYQK